MLKHVQLQPWQAKLSRAERIIILYCFNVSTALEKQMAAINAVALFPTWNSWYLYNFCWSLKTDPRFLKRWKPSIIKQASLNKHERERAKVFLNIKREELKKKTCCFGSFFSVLYWEKQQINSGFFFRLRLATLKTDWGSLVFKLSAGSEGISHKRTHMWTCGSGRPRLSDLGYGGFILLVLFFSLWLAQC